MHLDVAELRRFYYRTHLGQLAQRSIRASLNVHWKDVKGANFAGFGFASPFLRPYMGTALRTLSLMPAEQGAFHWPFEAPNISVLCEERRWPLAAGFVDRMIIAHALENSERPKVILDEAQRVLAPGGRALVIVPNRTGLWARSDHTPFGHGRPFSVIQLENLLRSFSLEPVRHSAALYFPPSQRKYWMKSAAVWERFGRKINAQSLAGAIVVEVEKTSYAAPRGGVGAAVKGRREVFGGIKAPAAKPVVSRFEPDD